MGPWFFKIMALRNEVLINGRISDESVVDRSSDDPLTQLNPELRGLIDYVRNAQTGRYPMGVSRGLKPPTWHKRSVY